MKRSRFPIERSCVLAGAFLWLACASETPGGERGAHWTLVPELRIGSVDDSRYAFTHIVDLTVGPEGNLYVTQQQVPEVAVYGPRGEFLGRLGRQGSGPGEFLAAGRMGWKADTLWVEDLAAKIHLFESDGRFVRTIHFVIADPAAGGNIKPRAALADGSVLGAPPVFNYAVLVRGLERIAVTRVSSGGEVLDTLAWRDLRRYWHEIRYRDEGAQHALQPFPATTFLAVRANGRGVLLVDPEPSGRASAYRVVEVSLEGDTVFDAYYDYAPIAITDELVEGLVSARYESSEYLQDRVSFARYRDAFLTGLARPAHHPPVTEVLAGADGALWLRREDLGRDSVRWDVLDASRRHIASLKVPADATLKHVGPDRVWVVTSDPLDVPYLVRYRIERE